VASLPHHIPGVARVEGDYPADLDQCHVSEKQGCQTALGNLNVLQQAVKAGRQRHLGGPTRLGEHALVSLVAWTRSPAWYGVDDISIAGVSWKGTEWPATELA
jgi:hypothetical protein